MGERLFPSPQIKNIITTLVKNGSISGPLAHEWNAKTTEKKNMEELLRKARNGSVEHMRIVAILYQQGIRGFEQNDNKSFMWANKSHMGGDITGTAITGYYYLEGKGVTACHNKGMMYTGIAAGAGSAYAAYTLGTSFANGYYGLEVENIQASHWA